MKKFLIGALAVTAIVSLGAAAGCMKAQPLPSVVVNGGFESADLSGWTVEYGDAYDNDSVSSRKTFSYTADIDPHGYVIPVNQTGNWYLSGKGFDNARPSTCTGAIRSQNFVLGGDGYISMKLAGGSQATARSDTAAQKPAAEVCYVGIYRASDNRMIASQTNRYFAEDSSNIELADYENGTCYTDNFCQYNIDLSEYIGEVLYIRIVDNDTSYYYGYLSVDDIRIGKKTEPQQEGAYFAKTSGRKTAQAPSEYEIANGDFETGNLSGWEVTEGLAFSDDGVNCNPYWWAEQIPYERDGNYHYGYYNPTATGRMKSTVFTVGGTGYVTYKLGGCADNNAAYLRFMKVTDGAPDREILRVSNFAFKDMQFPNVQNGMRVINMNQYRLNLSPYNGEKMYIEVVDENSSDNMAGCIVLDSVRTFHETVPQFTQCFDVDYDVREIIPDCVHQVKNGGFETGDLTGWNHSGNIGEVSSESTWWAEKLPYNKSGSYLFTGLANESGTGNLTSSPFTVGGAGWMTFRFGGAYDPRFCYISLIDEHGNELARYGNYMFRNAGLADINRGSNIYNMVTYRADISEFRGRSLRIRVVDNATSNWGCIVVDSFVTYYEDTDVSRFPANSVEVINLLTCANNVPESEFQVKNGNFEGADGNGSLDGWTLSGNIGNLSYEYLWWNEWYTYNKEGLFLFSGFQGNEGDKGTLTSSPFTVGGSGLITYRLGGGKNTDLCYMEIIDADNPENVYYRFGNEKFSSRGGVYIGYPITVGCEGFGANMVLYKADLSAIKGKRVRLRLTDNAANDWGLLFADDFVTYYEKAENVPSNAVEATDILPRPEFSEINVRLNLAYGQNTYKIVPVKTYGYYTCSYALKESVQGVLLSGDVITVNPTEDTPVGFEKDYPVELTVTVRHVLTGEEITVTVAGSITLIYDNRQILNGDFETGDLTGWTLSGGRIHSDKSVSSAETFFDEMLPYNKGGTYHFDGWGAQYEETETYSLKSEKFLLDGSGFISFKAAGRSAVVKVYRAQNDELIAEYDNTQFSTDRFPYVDEGCREATMTTFLADLSAFKGEELYIEICDGKEGGNWGVVFFDDIVTYYETAPNVAQMKDTVHLHSGISATGKDCDYDIQWVVAVNKINH